MIDRTALEEIGVEFTDAQWEIFERELDAIFASIAPKEQNV